jgi:secreted trypsin-like serine protease
LIIGGHDAPASEYPYFATFDHFGGGILIAPDIILTAGHVYPPLEQNVQVRLNHSHFDSTNFAAAPKDDNTYGIAAMVRHPDFYTISWDEKVNDFNIFLLDGQSSITPVKLNRNFRLPKAGQMVKVVGMGSTSPDPATFVESSATTLQEVELQILSQRQCLEQSGDPDNRSEVSYQGRLFEESMICTSGGPHNEKDACAFDSGSPLLIKNRRGKTRVVGMVSWGENCADPYFPAVNTRVSYAMDWIDKTVCKLSRVDPSELREFGCGDFDDDDDDYLVVEMYHDFSDIVTSSSGGIQAMLALVAAVGVGLIAVAYRLVHNNRPRSARTSVARRVSSISESVRLLSVPPAKAVQERTEGHSPGDSEKTYETFSGKSV